MSFRRRKFSEYYISQKRKVNHKLRWHNSKLREQISAVFSSYIHTTYAHPYKHTQNRDAYKYQSNGFQNRIWVNGRTGERERDNQGIINLRVRCLDACWRRCCLPKRCMKPSWWTRAGPKMDWPADCWPFVLGWGGESAGDDCSLVVWQTWEESSESPDDLDEDAAVSKSLLQGASGMQSFGGSLVECLAEIQKIEFPKKGGPAAVLSGGTPGCWFGQRFVLPPYLWRIGFPTSSLILLYSPAQRPARSWSELYFNFRNLIPRIAVILRRQVIAPEDRWRSPKPLNILSLFLSAYLSLSFSKCKHATLV